MTLMATYNTSGNEENSSTSVAQFMKSQDRLVEPIPVVDCP